MVRKEKCKLYTKLIAKSEGNEQDLGVGVGIILKSVVKKQLRGLGLDVSGSRQDLATYCEYGSEFRGFIKWW